MACQTPSTCPVCDADVPRNAKSCWQCGACAKTGWNPDVANEDGLNFPNDDFDYEKFTAEEFGTPHGLSRKEWIVRAMAGFLLLLMIGSFLVSLIFR